MKNNIQLLNNMRLLRSQSKELPLTILEELVIKLQAIIDERKYEEESLLKQQQEQQDKIKRYIDMMKSDGIDINNLLQTEILSETKITKTKRAPRPAKYKYLDKDNKETLWTGQGRTPSVIQKALDKGAKLEDFLI